jgi:hypothetical protein
VDIDVVVDCESEHCTERRESFFLKEIVSFFPNIGIVEGL